MKMISNQPKAISYVVSFDKYSDAEKLIHECNYKQYDQQTKTLAMWNGQKPRFEIFVSGAPTNSTRRDFFLAMEKFGAIGRVTPCKSVEGSAWVSFNHQNSYKRALASNTYWNGKLLNVKMTENNNDFVPVTKAKKFINFGNMSALREM